MEFIQNVAPSLFATHSEEPNFVGKLVYIAFVVVVLFALMAYGKSGLTKRVFTNWAAC